METKILEDKKNKLVFEIVNSPESVFEMIKGELKSQEDVQAVGTHTAHPLVKKQVFMVETKTKDPRKMIKEACKNLAKSLDEAKSSLKSLK
jgi:DNA-directed RNA polymerase subunit L